MKVERSNEFGVLVQARLDAFEQRIGHRLPEDYRKFLLVHNGGRPDPCAFYFPGKKDAFDVMHHTLGLHDGPNYVRLDKTYEVYQGRMPDSVISFADDPGGNAYCIAISGKDRGKVYFWDHEQEETGGNLRLLANSFTEFLSRLGEE